MRHGVVLSPLVVFARGALKGWGIASNGCFQPKIGGKTPKWMVYFMEIPIKMDDLGVYTPIFGSTPKWPSLTFHSEVMLLLGFLG